MQVHLAITDRRICYRSLTLYRHIKTAEQRTIIQQRTVIGTLAVDGWTVAFGTARRGPPRRAAAPPSHVIAVPNVTAHPSMRPVGPTNLILFDVALLPLRCKGVILTTNNDD